MKRFEFTDDLLTGIEDIDNHHRRLLELGNLVIDPSAIKTDALSFEDAIKFLTEYVIYHFAAEEDLMIESNYPYYEHHRQWHERFKQDIFNYANRAESEGISKNIKLKVSFAIENWLLEHIRITDRTLAKYLQEQEDGAYASLSGIRTLKDKGMLPETFNERLSDATIAE